MKRYVPLILTLFAFVLTSHRALAAPAVTVKVEPDASRVTLTVANATPSTRCSDDVAALRRCLAPAGQCDADAIYDVSAPATFDLIDMSAAHPAPAWLRRVLSDTSVTLQCLGSASAALQPATIAIDAASPLTPTGGIEPESGTPKTLIWGGWQAPVFRRIWAKLGTSVTNCQLTSEGVAVPSCVPSLANSRTTDGTKLVQLTYTGAAIESGSVSFDIGAFKFNLRISHCAFSPKLGELTSLLAGADLQTIEVAAASDCSARTGATRLHLRNGNVTLTATSVTPTPSGTLLLTLHAIPESVGAGSWSLETDDGIKLGAVELGVIAHPIAVRSVDGAPLLGIHYDIADGKLDLDQWHDGKSVAGRAVVTSGKDGFENYVQNTASLDMDPQLLGLARQLARPKWDQPASAPLPQAAKCSDQATTCSDLDDKAQACDDAGVIDEISPHESDQIDDCHAWHGAWRVRPHSWQESAWIKEGLWWQNASSARADELGEITFAVLAPQPHPFQVAVELVSKDSSTGAEQVVFRKYLTLANAAQVESMPLPLAQALYVECGHHDEDVGIFPAMPPSTDANADVITNGFTKAVNDEDVLAGGCRLNYSKQIVARAFGRMRRGSPDELLKYYGRQELTVTVRRGEATETKVWSIDPLKDQELELPVPRDAKNAIGIYSVTATLRGPSPPSVTWRRGSATQPGTAAAAMGDLEFHANLRPRGPFGWKVAPIRVFMTFPVSFTGARFPAKPSDLKKSSSFPNAQITKIEVGALLAIEPWSYDTGHNPWPVPTRFMTGMNFYNASDGNFSPSWLTGVSFTLPIVDLQKGVAEDQLGTDLALGIFWEADVGSKQWYRRGNHLLITFGVNLLSLFGSK